jgi:hypothetical protein
LPEQKTAQRRNQFGLAGAAGLLAFVCTVVVLWSDTGARIVQRLLGPA